MSVANPFKTFSDGCASPPSKLFKIPQLSPIQPDDSDSVSSSEPDIEDSFSHLSCQQFADYFLARRRYDIEVPHPILGWLVTRRIPMLAARPPVPLRPAPRRSVSGCPTRNTLCGPVASQPDFRYTGNSTDPEDDDTSGVEGLELEFPIDVPQMPSYNGESSSDGESVEEDPKRARNTFIREDEEHTDHSEEANRPLNEDTQASHHEELEASGYYADDDSSDASDSDDRDEERHYTNSSLSYDYDASDIEEFGLASAGGPYHYPIIQRPSPSPPPTPPVDYQWVIDIARACQTYRDLARPEDASPRAVILPSLQAALAFEDDSLDLPPIQCIAQDRLDSKSGFGLMS